MAEALIILWNELPLFLQLGLKIGAIILPLLGMVAYYTLAERKVIAYMHVRVGPNRVGPKGLLQPCLLYTSPSPRDQRGSRMPSSA